MKNFQNNFWENSSKNLHNSFLNNSRRIPRRTRSRMFRNIRENSRIIPEDAFKRIGGEKLAEKLQELQKRS